VIGSLRGRLLDRDPRGEVLVEVGGVGYRVLVPTPTLSACDGLGAEVFLWTHLYVREGVQCLYGFATREERACFEALLGARGVGPSLALALLSAHSPASLREAVAAGDLDALCAVPGVGRKTAARLLVELKARLALPEAVAGDGPVPDGAGSRAEVRAALAALGYGHDEVRDVLAGLPADGAVPDLLRLALQHLGARR
jgi:Holliday junction DNA helicase RuvA